MDRQGERGLRERNRERERGTEKKRKRALKLEQDWDKDSVRANLVYWHDMCLGRDDFGEKSLRIMCGLFVFYMYIKWKF